MPDDAFPPLFGISQRQPPMNLRAEQALLGALLSNNKVHDRVADFLHAEHFADPVNGRVYSEIDMLIRAGRLADGVTLKSVFENSGILDEVGGTAYIAQLLGSTVAIINAGEYARAVHNEWLKRQAIEIGEDLVNQAMGAAGSDGQDLIASATESLLDLGERGITRSGTDFCVAARDAVLSAQAAHRGDPGHTRLDTGITGMDALWAGLWPGQLYYLMARSRTGKTPAMMQIARHVAGQLLAEADASGQPCGHVHIFSLEMSAADLMIVNLASTTRWTSDQIKAGQIGGAAEWLEFERAAGEIAKLPIIIDDQADMDLGSLSIRARSVRRQRRTRLICVDYRELIRRGKDQARMSLPEWIPFLGYQLKALAKSAGVPVIALAQINKARDGQESTRPTLGDLPYDGGQAADGVFALHRPELYMADDQPPRIMGIPAEKQATRDAEWRAQREASRGIAEFLALKRRFGPPGLRRLRFDGPRMRFSDPPTIGSDLPSDSPDLWRDSVPTDEAHDDH